MRDWNLPRPLVRWLDALSQNDPTADSYLDPVFLHLEGLEVRSQALRPLLAGFPDSAELWSAYGEALEAYRAALTALPSDPDTVLDTAVALEESVLSLRALAAELPRITGNGAIDEIFAVGMSMARGGEVEPDALLSRLVAGRDVVLRLQSQRSLFVRAFPEEEEIARHLGDAVEALEEGLGGAFLYLAEEQDGDLLEQAMRTLASGGSAAMAALAAMREVSEEHHLFSEDPVLEELFRAVEAGDAARIEVGLIALDDAHALLEGELEGLFATFAPQSWRTRYLAPLRQQWTALEAEREALHQAAAGSALSRERLQAFQALAGELDELEREAVETMPGRANLPNVAHLVGPIVLMGAVFEQRAPFLLLERELHRLSASYRDYQEHLERVYQGQAAEDHRALEHLLQAAEELGDGLALLETAVGTRDREALPQVWDALVEPATQLHQLASSHDLEGFLAEPEVPLPLFFAELRDLWKDRLARRLGPGEFMSALAVASKQVDELAAPIRGAGRDSPEAAPLQELLGDLSALVRRGLAGPTYEDLAMIESLGLEWDRRVPAPPPAGRQG